MGSSVFEAQVSPLVTPTPAEDVCAMNVSQTPVDGRFSQAQPLQMAGFFSRWRSRGAKGKEAKVKEPVPESAPGALEILFATTTGNAEDVANQAAVIAKARGLQPRVRELNAVSMEELAVMKMAIMVVATFGDGEIPDSGGLFEKALGEATAPRLEQLSFGVIALGDKSYETFCRAGTNLDARLAELGGQRLGPRVNCDVDYEEPARAWLAQYMPNLSDDGALPTADVGGGVGDRRQSYPVTMLQNRLLSGPGSSKEVRHYTLDLSDTPLSYSAGDCLAVQPLNDPQLVQALLARLDAAPDVIVPGHDGPLAELLEKRFEIHRPSAALVEAVASRADHALLSQARASDSKEALASFLYGRDVLDVLNLAPNLVITPEEFVGWLRPLLHRTYSISSSPKTHPGQVHLTVATVRWDFEGRAHGGVCSTYLADRVPCMAGAEGVDESTRVSAHVLPNSSFRIPEDDTVPVIMVGPGTGIAPFRAFLEERRERAASGANWLFFGDQRRQCDFAYEEELTAMLESGLLSRLELAFSRDQAEKVYVQDRMHAQGAALYKMLINGAHFYVCGDANAMAPDVDRALHRIVEEHGQLTQEQATAFVDRLKVEKRYVRDVY